MTKFNESLRSRWNSALNIIQKTNPEEHSIQKSNHLNFESHGYKLEKELGSNTAGGCLTYLATKIETQEEVIIKQFQFSQSETSWAGYEAYEREMKLLQSLEHSGIPRYLDSFETSAGFCLVQEYKPGKSLAESQQFSPEEIKEIALAILEILVYLQKQNPSVIHGDIKPENIIVDTSQQIKVYLIDFSWSRQKGGDAALSSMVKGTLGFMPPEQIFNRQLTKASDIYSLGATLICLLAQIKSTEIGEAIDETSGFNVKKLLPKLNPQFVKWLQKMVAFKLKDRYQDAATALEAVKPIPVVGKSSNSLETLLLRLKNNSHGFWLGLGTITAVAVLGTTFNVYQQSNSLDRFLSTGQGRGYNLSSIDFEGIDLPGVDLEQANLTDSNFRGSNLVGANLAEANLAGTNLIGANLQSADLEGAIFSDRQLGTAELGGANLQSANLKEASLESVNLAGANLAGADLERASLWSADLWGSNLSGTNLKEANLAGADLNNANLRGADLEYANLAGANLQRTSLRNADLSYANLKGADLTRTNLRGADLSHADLRGADLRRVDLRGADLSYANLKGANINRTFLRRANLKGAIMPDGSRHN
ncbi:MAG: serine/threonine-protein kinase [Prochloraceae cyanobacterium]|nr:serine/threonine-protein kinase [Prochloraceae cyanobacterium]